MKNILQITKKWICRNKTAMQWSFLIFSVQITLLHLQIYQKKKIHPRNEISYHVFCSDSICKVDLFRSKVRSVDYVRPYRRKSRAENLSFQSNCADLATKLPFTGGNTLGVTHKITPTPHPSKPTWFRYLSLLWFENLPVFVSFPVNLP